LAFTSQHQNLPSPIRNHQLRYGSHVVFSEKIKIPPNPNPTSHPLPVPSLGPPLPLRRGTLRDPLPVPDHHADTGHHAGPLSGPTGIPIAHRHHGGHHRHLVSRLAQTPHTICPLCKGTPLVETGARLHERANGCPLTHGTSTILSILFLQRFRCMYCGTDYDLLKESKRHRSLHQAKALVSLLQAERLTFRACRSAICHATSGTSDFHFSSPSQIIRHTSRPV
jgi:transposase-like protein